MTHVVLIAHRRSFHSTLISKCRLTAGNSIIEMLLTRRYNNLVNYFVFSDSLSRISTIMTGMVYFPCFLNQYFACFFSLDVVMNKHNTRTISIILKGITTTNINKPLPLQLDLKQYSVITNILYLFAYIAKSSTFEAFYVRKIMHMTQNIDLQGHGVYNSICKVRWKDSIR